MGVQRSRLATNTTPRGQLLHTGSVSLLLYFSLSSLRFSVRAHVSIESGPIYEKRRIGEKESDIRPSEVSEARTPLQLEKSTVVEISTALRECRRLESAGQLCSSIAATTNLYIWAYSIQHEMHKMC